MGRSEQITLVLTVPEQETGRLDQYLVRELPAHSRSSLQNWIKSGLITVNGEVTKTGFPLSPGDQIEIRQALRESGEAAPEPEAPLVPLNILYEDDAVLVVNKPAGLTVHPGAGTKGQPTLIASFRAHMGTHTLPGDEDRPGIVHRLDKDTSGVMVLAKTTEALRHLAAQFRDKSNLREYVALLDGPMEHPEQSVESYLHRDPRARIRFAAASLEEYAALEEEGRDLQGYRYALTHFSRRKVYGNRLSLATMRLSTGRTHQIRVHAKQIGCAVVGDSTYASVLRLPNTFAPEVRTVLEAVNKQLLHARRLGFVHPVSGEKLAFEAPLPETFRNVLELLEKHSHSKV